jgi:flagellar motor switch/type III secretory pathway protein FliN
MRQELLAGATALAFATAFATGSALAAEVNNNNNADNAQYGRNRPAMTQDTEFMGNDSVFERDRVQLTSGQEHQIYQAAQETPEQSMPHSAVLSVGLKLPRDIQLSAVPNDIEQNIGSDKLKDYKFARTQQGNVLLVDPTDNTVVAVITKSEGMQTASSGSATAVQNATNGKSLQHETNGAATVGTAAGRMSKIGRDRIELTAKEQQAVFQSASELPEQAMPKDANVTPGAELPLAVQLSMMPIDVKNKVGAYRMKDYKLARIENGDVLVVDPVNRVIQTVISKEEAE